MSNENFLTQINFQENIAGIRDDFQKEITLFGSEIEEIKLTPKFSRYKNEPQRITEILRANTDLSNRSARENQRKVFGVAEKSSKAMVTILDGFSLDKK